MVNNLEGLEQMEVAELVDHVDFIRFCDCGLMAVAFRKVFISFGGLLLYLDGPFKKLTGLRVDYVYLLVKK